MEQNAALSNKIDIFTTRVLMTKQRHFIDIIRHGAKLPKGPGLTYNTKCKRNMALKNVVLQVITNNRIKSN